MTHAQYDTILAAVCFAPIAPRWMSLIAGIVFIVLSFRAG